MIAKEHQAKSLLLQLFYLTVSRYKLEPVLRCEKIGCSTCGEWMFPLVRWTLWHTWNVSLDIVCVYICLFAFFWHNHCPTFWYREGPLTLKLRGSKCQIIFTVRKNGQQKTYMQLLWQHCSTTTELNSATALEKKNLVTWFVARQVRTLVVKRATSLFSFCRNVVELIRSRHAKLEALDWKRVLFSFRLGTFFLQLVLTFSYFSLTPNPLTFLVVPVVLKGDFQLHYWKTLNWKVPRFSAYSE